MPDKLNEIELVDFFLAAKQEVGIDCRLSGFSLTTMSALLLEPDKLRPVLMDKLRGMRDEDLPLLQMVLLRLERDRAFRELTDEFAQDRRDGKYDNLDAIILEARAALRTA